MIYPKIFNTRNAGSIIFDVILALALSTLFVSSMTAMSIEARTIYMRAKIRSDLLSTYIDHSSDFLGMMPDNVRSVDYKFGTSTYIVNITAKSVWYGNDRIETVMNVKGEGQSISLSSVKNYPFGDINRSAGTPLCSPDILGGERFNQQNIEIDSIILPINPLLPLTDLEVRNGVAYISVDSTKASDPDIIILNILDPDNSALISSLDTGPGISSLAVSGNYIYAAGVSTVSQLQVIRLNSLTSPVLVKKYKLSLPTPSTTPTVGSFIFYNNNIVYLGTEKWDGSELQIINVSNPIDPKISGKFETDSKINSIYVNRDVAYIASANKQQIQEVDVSDYSMPRIINELNPSGWARQEGKTVSVFENSVNAGRTSGGFDILADHELFSWNSVTSTPVSINIPGGVYGVVADRYRYYLATRDIDREFTIVDRSLDPSSELYYPLPVAPQTITCDEDSLYILAHSAPVVYKISYKINPKTKP